MRCIGRLALLFSLLYGGIASAQPAEEQPPKPPKDDAPFQESPVPPNHKIVEIDSKIKEKEEEIKKIEVKIEETKQNADKKILIEKIEKTKEEIKEDKEKKQLVTIDDKYQKGKELIEFMQGSSSTFLLIGQFLALETNLSQIDSIWVDEEFRNTWDAVEQWGTIAGAGVSLVGAVILTNNNENNEKTPGIFLGIGAGTFAVTKLLGTLLGEDKNKKIKEKTHVIELTRRAYDDLSIRIDHAAKFKKTTETLSRDLKEFKQQYEKIHYCTTENSKENPCEDERTVKSRAITELSSVSIDVLSKLEQLSSLIDDYDVLVAKYDQDKKGSPYSDLKDSPAIKKIYEIIDEVRKALGELKTNYNENVKPFIQRPKLRAYVFSPSL
jgi:hypothetical protein